MNIASPTVLGTETGADAGAIAQGFAGRTNTCTIAALRASSTFLPTLPAVVIVRVDIHTGACAGDQSIGTVGFANACVTALVLLADVIALSTMAAAGFEVHTGATAIRRSLRTGTHTIDALFGP